LDNRNSVNRFLPNTTDIIDVESKEEFDVFYKKINEKHLADINIKKEMELFVKRRSNH
jgi:hypothetical protein